MNDQAPAQERPFGGFGDSSSYDGSIKDGEFYPATLLGVKERLFEGGQYPGWKVIWGFDLVLHDGTKERVEAMSSTATGPDSKAGDWLVALVGQQRYEQRGTRIIGPDELSNIKCRVYVKFNDRGWPRIEGVFPQEAAPQPSASAAPTQSAEDFDDLPF